MIRETTFFAAVTLFGALALAETPPEQWSTAGADELNVSVGSQTPSTVRGIHSAPCSGSAVECARLFLATEMPDAASTGGGEVHRVGDRIFVRFAHVWRDLTVVGRATTVELSSEHRIEAVSGLTAPLRITDGGADVGEEVALRNALRALNDPNSDPPGAMARVRPARIQRVVVADGQIGTIAYEVRTAPVPPRMAPIVYIRAHDGDVVWIRDGAIH